MTINEMAQAAHDNAKEKGFWDDRDPQDVLSGLAEMALIGTEVSEAAEAIRGNQKVEIPQEDAERLLRNATGRGIADSDLEERCQSALYKARHGNLAEELADILIRVGDTAAARGIDLEAAVESKMEKNRSRPRMHGRKA